MALVRTDMLFEIQRRNTETDCRPLVLCISDAWLGQVDPNVLECFVSQDPSYMPSANLCIGCKKVFEGRN